MRSGGMKRYEGVAGEYLFPSLSPEEQQAFKSLVIPLPGRKAAFDDVSVKGIYTQVMQGRGIRQAMFNNLKLRQASFNSSLRRALVRPEKLHWEVGDDELYKGKKKITLQFRLPRGSFATMFLKRIFADSGRPEKD